jgi:poly-gamma-glutamate synthesis protein (capsule biosynthesis protein)
VPEEEIDALRRLSERLGFEEIKRRRNALGFPKPWGGFDETDAFTLLNVGGTVNPEFEVGDEYAVQIEADEDDVDAITRRLDAAARQADWVLASLRAHEGAAGRDTDRTIPEFLERFARACTDAGADAFVGHGPHTLRGIEVYEGAPIFYSLGNFLFQTETISRYPAEAYERNDLGPEHSAPDVFDAGQVDDVGQPIGFLKERHFYESLLPVCQFEDGAVERIDLHPIELGFDRDRPHRGRPRLASGAAAERIVTRLSELSEPYDTAIEFRGDVGVLTC